MTGLVAVREALDEVTDLMDDSFGQMADRVAFGGFEPVWQDVRRTATTGKLARPRLLLATRRAFGTEPDESAVRAAAAVELLHYAFLLHDDVIDRDLVRRGEPNLIARRRDAARASGAPEAAAAHYGASCAILAGDLLIAAAYRLLAEIDEPLERRRSMLRVLENAVGAAATGEHADVLFALRGDAEEEEILTTMMHKTARYSFTAPLQLGALLGGASAESVGALGFLGDTIGVAFQARDDVLGVFGDPAITGKSALSDLREGKLTLLTAAAKSDPSWAPVAHLFGDPMLGEDDAVLLRGVIESSGARDRAEAQISRLADEARTSMDLAPLPPALIDVLERMIAGATERIR